MDAEFGKDTKELGYHAPNNEGVDKNTLEVLFKETDSAPEPRKNEPSSQDSKLALFGAGLFHGAIENPYNGAVQFVNHLSGSNLPELHLVDETNINASYLGRAGSIIGEAVDIYGLALATGGLGVGVRTIVALGAYAGIFHPSNPNSKNFFSDRAKTAAVMALSTAGSSVAMSGLNRLGAFAVQDARTLTESLSFGSLLGAAGATVYSEADALINQGKLLPSFSEFCSNLGWGITAGALGGGISHAYKSMTTEPLAVRTVETGDSSLFVTMGRDGQPVKYHLAASPLANQSLPGYGGRLVANQLTHGYSGRLMTNGTWDSTAFDRTGAPSAYTQSRAGALTPTPNGFRIAFSDSNTGRALSREFSAGGDAKMSFWTDLNPNETALLKFASQHSNMSTSPFE